MAAHVQDLGPLLRRNPPGGGGELVEQPGLSLVGRLVDGPDADLVPGAAVETVFRDLDSGELAVPSWRRRWCQHTR